MGDPYNSLNIEANNAIPGPVTDPYSSSMVASPPFVSASTLPSSHSSHGLQAPRAPMVPYGSSMVAPPPLVTASTLSFSHSSHGLQAPMVSYWSNMVVPPLYVSASTLPLSDSSHGLQAPRAPMVEPHRSSMVAPLPYASMLQFSHSGHGGHFSNIGGPQADLQAPRAPLYLPGSPPVTYGGYS